MSNERIDLTQFDGIGDLKHNLFMEKTPTDGFHWSVCFENDVEAEMSTSSEFGRSIVEDADRFYHAINALPNLIAELKRSYDLIDAANRCIDQASKELQNCADCGGHREEEGLLHDCQNYCRCDEFFDESASE